MVRNIYGPAGRRHYLIRSRLSGTAAFFRSRRDVLCCRWIVFLGLLILPRLALAQISPGPLSRAHQDLAGTTGCVRCHALSPSSPNLRCLECHQEIASRLQQKRGWHPTLVGKSPAAASCARCHSEHNGENFSLLHWAPASFDHSNSGFPLDGKHSGLKCSQCHNASRIIASERATLRARDLNRTFLGLNRACASCHEDKHKGQLGTNCLQCHNTSDWKKTSGFDHSKTRFALTGAHRDVKCQSCHSPQPDGSMKYFGLKFERCASCHSDPHRAAFKQSCETCHNTSAWRQTSFAREFDHSKTRYPLQGKHAELRCNACHRGGDFKTPIAFQNCADCHTPDPHRGQFAKRADGGRCETCHTVQGFKPASFGVPEHAGTGFPLHGKHISVACAKCHVPAGKNTLFKVKFATCTDCHKDVHQSQFASAPHFNRCQDCHDDSTFKPSSFTLARHQKSGFVLTGGHIAVACTDCHKPVIATQPVDYHFANLSCTTCHQDIHRGQFRDRMSRVTASGRVAGCEACHSTKEWADLAKFDHSATKFPLAGAHRAVECMGCHRPPNMERRIANVDFRIAPIECEQCHDDPHGGQFAHADRNTRCMECHDSSRWRPSLFDHEKTVFSLKGGHQDVRCAACHSQKREVAGKVVVFYKPTPTACAACHGNGVPAAPLRTAAE